MDVTTNVGRLALTENYRETLLGDVIPFWLRHSLDGEHGGYLTALDRDGTVIDSDKSIWFQGRGAWMFATLFNTVDKKSQWLEAARSGIEFLWQSRYIQLIPISVEHSRHKKVASTKSVPGEVIPRLAKH